MKLHLGCGARRIPGWVHVDLAPYPHIDVKHGVDSLPMFGDGAAETIYACHVLEHFARKETLRVLLEWRRVLKVGGTLRVCVPNFAEWTALYHDVAKTSTDPRAALDAVHGSILGRQDHPFNVHYQAFDEVALRDALLAAGFREPRRYDWRETEHAWLDDFSQTYWPHMDKEHGRLMSLNMEATK